jgi:hypothetical protein
MSLKSEELKWNSTSSTSSIAVNTRLLKVSIQLADKATCYVDYITLLIIRQGEQ